jgi:ribosomal protein L30/L7E
VNSQKRQRVICGMSGKRFKTMSGLGIRRTFADKE